MEKQVSLVDLFFLILRRLPYIIIATLLGAGLMFSMSKFVIEPTYQSDVSLYVKNSSENSSSQGSINQGDLTVSKSLVNTYIVILKNDAVMDEIADRLMEKHSLSELAHCFAVKDGRIVTSNLRGCFSMAAVNSTEVLNIVATTKDAEISQELCSVMADVAPDFLIRVVGAGSVEKIGDAKVNYNKVAPSVTKNTLIGGFAGMLLMILIVFLIDFFDNTIKDTDDLQEKFRKPLLGEIPHIGGKTKKKELGKSSDRKLKLLFQNPKLPFSVVEDYKSMRTNVSFSLSTAENKVLAVTSSLPSEGKSVTIANLAVTMSEADKKILLIDADMRKSVQHKNFNLHNKKGLSTVLSGEAAFDECVHRGVRQNLDVLSSGVIPPNPSELLASKNMRELIEKIKEQYDYILIDTPPILQMTDVIGLADLIAGVAVVISYGRTTYYEIQGVQQKLELGNCNLMGFILNNIPLGSGHGYGYGKYYGHYGRYGGYKQYYSNYRYEQQQEKMLENEGAAQSDEEKTPDKKKTKKN